MQIHFLSLQRPFDAVAHSPERPENQNENIDHRDAEKSDEAIPTESLSQITKSSRRHVHHFLTTAPEEQSRDNHRYAGNSKSPSGPPLWICKEPWTEDGGDKRTSVNREIEPAKHLLEQMLVRFAKLIANIGRYAWFDATCAQTNQRQSYCEHRPLSYGHSPGSGHARECQVAQAVNDR